MNPRARTPENDASTPEKVGQETKANADGCSCSISLLLRGTTAEHLKLMMEEFSRRGGKLDLQQVNSCIDGLQQ